jgi:4-hydroxybenzoate polyprenyltransferase
VSGPGPLLRAAHPAPAAVAAGQLGIGWSNDLVDAGRDREVGRADKPVARGEVAEVVVRRAVAVSLLACVALSLACGLGAGLLHLVVLVGSGWAYNLLLKRTVWSAVPYALAFGCLPAVVTLALPDPAWPPAWMLAAGAILGVGAHLLNALPDLADDERTGVHALPHRLGARRVRVLAPLVLLAGSVVATRGPGTPGEAWPWVALGACVVLAVVAVTGRGRLPFLAAIAIALVDVLSLVGRS